MVLFVLILLSIANAQENCSSESTLNKLKELIDKYYLWRSKLADFNPANLEDAIGQLRKIGDPWTTITKESEDRLWYNQSKLIGIGIRWNDEGVITKVFNNSPAQVAGLKRYDKILSIQGERNIDKWVERIRRTNLEEPVEVVILRDGKLIKFYVYKDKFEIPSVDEVHTFELNGKKYGYVQLNNFTNPSVELFFREVERLKTENIDVLVIDLRYNSGGLISVVRKIAGMFVGDEQPIFYLEHARGGLTIYNSEYAKATYDREIILLVSKATASASEILASLLRHYKKAKIIGSLSAGKYVGSNMYRLNDCGDILRLISFEVKLMDGYPVVSQIGIVPDCFVRQPTNYFPEELIKLCEENDPVVLK